MAVDAALLSSGAVRFGALIGGGASLAVAVRTQRNKDRLQRIARQMRKPPDRPCRLHGEGVHLVIDACVHDANAIELSENGQKRIGLINRMRLLAPPQVVSEAEAALKAIIAISLQPALAFGVRQGGAVMA